MHKISKLRLAGVLWVSAAFSAVAAQQVVQVVDPANLTGEHVAPQSPADTLPINHGAAALQQLLLKLRTRASMMLIVAHPDDEDGGLLTYESRGQGVRVAMLTLNRGEGGQNLMSGDFNDALGLIRTQELLAADRYLGVDQMFGTEVDFGFSKTKEETFEKWTHERVLYDAVRAVRLYRPLVLASVFVGGPTDGHGHHQVAGEITQEVFKAAADPNVFPEMIKEGLLPWAPLKVYARVPFSRVAKDGMFDYATGKTIPTRFENYVTGAVTNEVPTATVTIHEGDAAVIDGKPALGMEGKSYIQFAREGLGLQKTQVGPGVRMPPPGVNDAGYTRMGSRLADSPAKEKGLFDGIDTSLAGIAALGGPDAARLRARLLVIDQLISEAQKAFDATQVQPSAEPLAKALRSLDELLADVSAAQFAQPYAKANVLHELRIKRVQLNDAVVLALGVTVEAISASDQLRPHGSLVATASSKYEIEVEHGELTHVIDLVISGPASALKKIMPQPSNKDLGSLRFNGAVDFPPSTPVTKPYFSRPDIEQPYYNIDDPALRDASSTPFPFVARANFDFAGVKLEIEQAFVAENTHDAISLVPPLSIETVPASGIVRPGDGTFKLATMARGSFVPAAVGITLTAPQSWRVTSSPDAESKPGDKAADFTVETLDPAAGRQYQLTAIATYAHKDYRESFRAVGYPGLVYTNYYKPSIYRLTAVDVTTAPNLKVAYLRGTGDDVPDFLPDLGVKPVLLTPKDLNVDNLKQYDAVVLGVRAYAAQSALAGKGSQPLLDYARDGGVVIVQYMTAKYGDAEAPYAIAVPGDSAHNVVVEADPVMLLAPDAPLLTWPNRITSADFDHWVEERGHGFAASWAPEFQPLLEMHDPDQDPQKGGLLLASVGKGAYIYCSLALYRQLPEGVPGAYRLFANLLSYAKNPHRN